MSKAFDSIMRGLREVKAMQEPKYGEWVSVRDMLPDGCGLVLVMMWCGTFGFANYNYGKWFDGSGSIIDPTYWMPLPEPPQEV
jgi:hypothetical protein